MKDPFKEKGKSKTNLELLERDLSLKQLQINRLLEVTQAINNNLAADALFKIYRSILSWEMGIEKMALYIKQDNFWSCTTAIGLEEEEQIIDITDELMKYSRMTNLLDNEHPIVSHFDIIIPVYHKKQPIAFALIGNLGRDEEMYEKIKFITTITNIISVAIENKRLFKRQIEQERLGKELELASQVQNMLIPSELPSNKKYELDSIYLPHSRIGGDYFDYIDFGSDEFAFCIADISGKGISAALLMANFQANLQSLIHRRLEKEDFIQQLNQSVLKITKGERFLTFFCCEVNLKTREMVYVNAGHNPPLMLMDGEIKQLNEGCTILGMFEQIPMISIGRVSIPKETLIVTYTDGLTDLRNEDDVFFDTKYLGEFIMNNNNASASELNTHLMIKINSFKGKRAFPDDISILTCRIF